LLDCGATVNLLSEQMAKKALGDQFNLRPAESSLKIYDNSELSTIGMLTATVENEKTGEKFSADFYVAKNQNMPILGSVACQRLVSMIENFNGKYRRNSRIRR